MLPIVVDMARRVVTPRATLAGTCGTTIKSDGIKVSCEERIERFENFW